MKSKINSGNLSVERAYSIETPSCSYDVLLLIDLFIQEGDSGTWDSDWDYYGYTDVNNIEITTLLRHSEEFDTPGSVVDFNSLTEEEQVLINEKIDNKVNEDDFSGELK